MTPTRGKSAVGPMIDTGTGSPVASRPNPWSPSGVVDTPASDSGVGSVPAPRSGEFDGDAFIPPLWL